MTAATLAGPRIATLDIVRGVAVMGILAMNIVAFAMPFQAYMNPTAFGMEGPADMVSWLVSFVFIDGKMRGLFSFLFGASLLLVVERAEASGQSAASVHYRRMIWLLVFGLIHFYFIWFGDILHGYAMVGMIAFLFRKMDTRPLVITGLALVVLQFLVFLLLAGSFYFMRGAATAPNADPEMVRQWGEMHRQFGPIAGAALSEKMAMFHGPWTGLVHDRLVERMFEPFIGLMFFGWETLAYMLFGMAGLKSGLMRGEWTLARYRKTALVAMAIAIPAYALIAWGFHRDGFSVPGVMAFAMAATVPFRPVMVLGYAALIILLTWGGGALTDRIAAAGRAAFTNYLGTSILMTTLFYGYGIGLYGSMSRAELWIVVVAMWVLMLLWSKPWLDRFRYGPFEWLWRSLSRWRLEPMRKEAAPAVAAAG